MFEISTLPLWVHQLRYVDGLFVWIKHSPDITVWIKHPSVNKRSRYKLWIPLVNWVTDGDVNDDLHAWWSVDYHHFGKDHATWECQNLTGEQTLNQRMQQLAPTDGPWTTLLHDRTARTGMWECQNLTGEQTLKQRMQQLAPTDGPWTTLLHANPSFVFDDL